MESIGQRDETDETEATKVRMNGRGLQLGLQLATRNVASSLAS
jgi:hypothetical protein